MASNTLQQIAKTYFGRVGRSFVAGAGVSGPQTAGLPGWRAPDGEIKRSGLRANSYHTRDTAGQRSADNILAFLANLCVAREP